MPRWGGANAAWAWQVSGNPAGRTISPRWPDEDPRSVAHLRGFGPVRRRTYGLASLAWCRPNAVSELHGRSSSLPTATPPPGIWHGSRSRGSRSTIDGPPTREAARSIVGDRQVPGGQRAGVARTAREPAAAEPGSSCRRGVSRLSTRPVSRDLAPGFARPRSARPPVPSSRSAMTGPIGSRPRAVGRTRAPEPGGLRMHRRRGK